VTVLRVIGGLTLLKEFYFLIYKSKINSLFYYYIKLKILLGIKIGSIYRLGARESYKDLNPRTT
jgi:hypothetical protein